jgi:lysozyme family protein
MNYPDVFNWCIKVILKNEGGYGNHPADPGGETIYGIADAADGKKDGLIDIDRDGTGDVKVKDLTIDQAKEIYYKRYWLPMKVEGIKLPELALQVFDMGVNAGIGRSARILQRVVGAKEDGDIGPKTLSLIDGYQGDILEAFKQARKDFYLGLAKIKPDYQVFIAGWLHRVEQTRL